MKKVFKKLPIFFILIFLTILLLYVSDIDNLPDSVIIFEGEALKLNTIFGVNIETEETSNPNIERINNNETITVAAEVQDEEEIDCTGTINLSVKVFGTKVKEISVNVIEDVEVVPIGDLIGVKLYTNGVLVVGMSEISGIDSNKYKPYEGSGIEEGDVIVEINKKEITGTYDLTRQINKSEGTDMAVTYIRDGKILNTTMKAVKTDEDTYKIGLWVRDAAAGVGTATFYEPESGTFASLGHGIVDADTDELIEIASGEVVTANILSIVKGKDGEPGKIQGSIDGQPTIGTIYKNTPYGIYGHLNNISALFIDRNNLMDVALRNEIQVGDASIISTLENGETKEYDVKIEKIYLNNNIDNKSMVIRVTDDELLNITGGIVQGMSGSPIIQNGKLVRCFDSCNCK